jgi:hypothetical protein
MRGRVKVINLWRPIHGPLHDAPLAVCDASTVEASDLAGFGKSRPIGPDIGL